MPDISLTLDSRVNRLSAVKKAAYRLGDRCFSQIEVLSDGSIQVRLTAKSEKLPLHTLEGDFRNEFWTKISENRSPRRPSGCVTCSSRMRFRAWQSPMWLLTPPTIAMIRSASAGRRPETLIETNRVPESDRRLLDATGAASSQRSLSGE